MTDFADLQVAEQNMQHRGARCPAQLPVSGNRVTEQAEDETLQPRVHRSRYLVAARHFFTRAMRAAVIPVEVTTDRAPAYPRVLDELIPSALHTVERYASNPVEADHGWLQARLRPIRGLKRYRSARILAAGHAFVQNLRRGRYDIATHIPARHQFRTAFDELAVTI